MLERDDSEIEQHCIKGGKPKSVIVGVIQKGSRYLMGTHLVEGCRAQYLVSLAEESNLALKMAKKAVMMVDTCKRMSQSLRVFTHHKAICRKSDDGQACQSFNSTQLTPRVD